MVNLTKNLNYLNLAGYVLNTFVTFFASPIFHLADISQQSASYQTLITPAAYAFSIWGIIFTTQGIFAAVQMHPAFRNLEIIQDGVKYWYFITCVMQSLWVFIALGTHQFILSTLVMIGILISLVNIVENQRKIHASVSTKEYWLFQFPFEIHCGWIYAASAITLNMCGIRMGAGAEMQFGMAILTMAGLVVIIFRYLERTPRPNYTIPLVLAWAAYGIFQELGDPKHLIVETFSRMEIFVFRILARMFCVGSLLGVMMSVIRNRGMEEAWRLGHRGEQVGLLGNMTI